MSNLHEYCSDLDLDGVKYAIAAGADVNEINSFGETPLTAAIQFHWAYYLELDKKYSYEERKELSDRAYQLLEPIMDCLIANGADLDLFGEGGITPLCAAYYANSVAATRYLLEHGANPNVNCHLEKDINYNRPIKSSVLKLIYDEVDDGESDPEIERLLLQYGGQLFEDSY